MVLFDLGVVIFLDQAVVPVFLQAMSVVTKERSDKVFSTARLKVVCHKSGLNIYIFNVTKHAIP